MVKFKQGKLVIQTIFHFEFSGKKELNEIAVGCRFETISWQIFAVNNMKY
jgi:hypothetical protein